VPNRPTICGEVFEVEKVEEKIDITKYLEQCLSGIEKVS